MIKVAMIGAGSIGFTRRLMRDILTVPELQDTVFSFTDISERNLKMVTQLARRDIRENARKAPRQIRARVLATTDRREALRDADYVVNMARVGGLEAFQLDIDIPLKYGVDQCVGDTLCAGGIMYGQRGIPEVLAFCKDIREVAKPGALFLNYGNPNAMLTWAANRYGKAPTIGLCHGVEGGHHQIADVLGLPVEEVDIICAGINHQTWYIQVRHKGKDLTGKLLEAFETHPHYRKTEKARIDVLRRTGHYCTESNGHLSEYVPWYRKRPEEIKDWISLDSWINGETGGYLRVCVEGRNWFERDFPNWMKQEVPPFAPEHRSKEHGSYIIESLETGRLYRGHFNVVNNGTISNLPDDAVIEVPGYVDGNGISIPRVGDLPLVCAAICNASISVQRLAVEAAVRGDADLLKQAMMMDPLVGAVCNTPEIWRMTDEMLVAQAQWLPQYKKAIQKAKSNLRGARPPSRIRAPEGAARLRTKTVTEMEGDREAASKMADAADKGDLTKKRPPAGGTATKAPKASQRRE
ncbi:MAG TPA: alpha-glucosidase/alpha-galactosidase [Sumerlaeia bacterium]|nr:alpha-glucosidase/alpha-galactosidase [Sumerlaeia bacterium]